MSHTVLGIETSQAFCSVALASAQGCEYVLDDRSRVHSSCLLPMIDQVLKARAIEVHQLDAIALSAGPGSFTGLRVGAAVAQGLAFAAGIPLIGVSSLYLLALAGAQQYPQAKRIICCIDARLDAVYCGAYQTEDVVTSSVENTSLMLTILQEEQRYLLSEYSLKSYAQDGDTLLLGDAIPALLARESIGSTHAIVDTGLSPRADDLVRHVLHTKLQGAVPAEAFELQYLGGASAWKKLGEQ